MVERLQREVTESAAKTDWHSVVAETLEKEIRSLRAVTRITEGGSELWMNEAKTWLEVQTELFSTKVEDVARKASEQQLSQLERQLRALFESARAELDRTVFETLVQRLAAIERRAEKYADSAVESVADRLRANGRETAARLTAHIDRRLDASIANAEEQARERLLGLAEELAAEIVAAEQAQEREREVRREAQKVAAGLDELRNVSRQAAAAVVPVGSNRPPRTTEFGDGQADPRRLHPLDDGRHSLPDSNAE
jgi:hypothetical protein